MTEMERAAERVSRHGIEQVRAAVARLHKLENSWAHNGHHANGGLDNCYGCVTKVLAVLDAWADAGGAV